MSFQIKINKTKDSRLASFNPENISFGKVFTDHMIVCDYVNNEWQQPELVPFSKIALSPALSALHYGQSIFEGLKAYKNEQGQITLFRPEQNARRLNASAHRMCMPAFPETLFIDCIKTLIEVDKDWIPIGENASLYLRPFMFATDEFLGIRPSDNYKFVLYACPVGKYYDHAVKVYIDEHYSRAVKGGVGAAKCAGNYAASLYPAKLAREKGYDQILWTDAFEHRYLEETGTSNIFVKSGQTIFTPPLSDSILPGITRDSVIILLQKMGYQVIEKQISVDELIELHKRNELDEMFVTGTAATVTNIQLFGYKNQNYQVTHEGKTLANEIKSYMYHLKTLTIEDPFGWIIKVEPSSVSMV
jgi:branched-chain amino acid aminotransferase